MLQQAFIECTEDPLYGIHTKNKIVNDLTIVMHNEKNERVYITKLLGVQIDAQLNWKRHIGYTCKKLWKCIGIPAKARRSYTNRISSTCTLYLHILISYIVTRFGAIRIRTIWKKYKKD